jgi:hypothetical protein
VIPLPQWLEWGQSIAARANQAVASRSRGGISSVSDEHLRPRLQIKACPRQNVCAPTAGLEPAHESNTSFQMLVIALQAVIHVLRGSMLRAGQHHAERRWVVVCLISSRSKPSW